MIEFRIIVVMSGRPNGYGTEKEEEEEAKNLNGFLTIGWIFGGGWQIRSFIPFIFIVSFSCLSPPVSCLHPSRTLSFIIRIEIRLQEENKQTNETSMQVIKTDKLLLRVMIMDAGMPSPTRYSIGSNLSAVYRHNTVSVV